MNQRHPYNAPFPSPRLVDASTAPSAWRFSVRCPQAEQVMLVTDDAAGLSSWVPMTAVNDSAGTWELDIPVASVAGPVRYYTVEAGSVLNCGTAGLSATRVKSQGKMAAKPLAATA